MSSLEIHLEQAKYNEELAAKLKQQSCGDWSITALFYSALHYVNHAIPDCQKFDTHVDRNDYLRINRPDVYTLFSPLSVRSRQVRYYPEMARNARVSTGVVVPQVEIYLAKLKAILNV